MSGNDEIIFFILSNKGSVRKELAVEMVTPQTMLDIFWNKARGFWENSYLVNLLY